MASAYPHYFYPFSDPPSQKPCSCMSAAYGCHNGRRCQNWHMRSSSRCQIGAMRPKACNLRSYSISIYALILIIVHLSCKLCLKHTSTCHDYSSVHVTSFSVIRSISARLANMLVLRNCTKTGSKPRDDFQLRICPACTCQPIGAVWEDVMLELQLSGTTATSRHLSCHKY